MCGDVNDQKITVQKSSGGGYQGKGTAGTNVMMFWKKGPKGSVAATTVINWKCGLREVEGG